MRTTRLILGIIGIVLFVIIMFQSCAVGISNSLEKNSTDTSGGGGMILAFLILIGGIIGVATSKSRAGSVVAGAFYLLAAMIGFTNLGKFGDLEIWSYMALIFGIVFLLGGVFGRKSQKQHDVVIVKMQDDSKS